MKKDIEAIEAEECIDCGLPEIDGLWYDNRCDECHDVSIVMSLSVAIKKMEVDNEKNRDAE
jgi:hypothetical protein